MNRIAAIGLLAYTFAITVARAARWPNDFAEAHWLIDYRFGPVKRGLVGSVVSMMSRVTGMSVTAEVIATLSVVALAATCGALLWMAVCLVRAADGDAAAVSVSLLFASSPFVMMTGHLVGYLDHVVIPLGILAIHCAIRGRPAVGGLLIALATLIHEVSLLLAFPAFCLVLLLRDDAAPRLSRYGPVLLPAIAAAFLLVSRLLSPADQLAASLTDHLSRFAFIEADRARLVPEWHTASLADSVASLRQVALRLSHPAYYLMVLPTTLAVIALLRRTLTTPRDRLFALAVIAAPQAMHLVAWDSTRIWTMSILTTFTLLWVCAATGRVRWDAGRRFLPAVAVGVCVHALYSTPLMDGEVDRFGMVVRAALYLPVLAGVLWLAARPERNRQEAAT